MRYLLLGALMWLINCTGMRLLGQDMPLSGVLLDGHGWELVASGYRFVEGPAVDRDGNVYFSDIPNSRIYKIERSGEVTLFADKTAETNGLMFGPDGRLYGCRNGDRQIVAYQPDGRRETVLDGIDSNDLVVMSTGGIYCTDPANKCVWYIGPGRQKRAVAEGFRPNGIALWPAEGTLVVTDSDAPHLWAFRVESDGSLKFGERYYHPLQMPPRVRRPGSDGMTVDREGRLYVATSVGLQMFDTTGRLGGVIDKPQARALSNAVFGGPNFGWLYVTCYDRVFRRKTATRGAPYFLRTRIP